MAIGKILSDVLKVTTRRSGRYADDAAEKVTKRGTTNANRLTPSLKEDVVASQREDARRISKALDPNSSRGTSGASSKSVSEAGGRSITRTAGRAAGVSAAGAAGVAAGTAARDSASKNRSDREEKAKRESDSEMMRESRRSPAKDAKEEAISKTKSVSTFGKAFREARDAGKKEFTYEGKKYHTKTKEEVESEQNMSRGGMVKKKAKKK